MTLFITDSMSDIDDIVYYRLDVCCVVYIDDIVSYRLNACCDVHINGIVYYRQDVCCIVYIDDIISYRQDVTNLEDTLLKSRMKTKTRGSLVHFP